MTSNRSKAGEQPGNHELTVEQFIEKVALIIAVKKMIDEQFRTGQLRMVKSYRPAAEILGLGEKLTIIVPVLELAGDDLTYPNKFTALGNELEHHSTAARAAAATNEKVAQALRDYTLFKQRLQDSAAGVNDEQNNDEYSLENMTL